MDMDNFYKLKSRVREVALVDEGYLPFDVLSALREQDLESFRENLWRQYESKGSWVVINDFWEEVGSDYSEFKPAALVAAFRPFTQWDIELIKLANKDTVGIVRSVVNSLICSFEENLPLNITNLLKYKEEVSEILIDAAGDGNTILAEELYDYVLLRAGGS
nr:MAG TPA: hypothetical protein [Caudoviricetes sp.]